MERPLAYFLKRFKISNTEFVKASNTLFKYLRLPLMEVFVTLTSFAVSSQTAFC